MIQLVSGGLDSMAIWRLLGKPHALYVEIGGRSQERELWAIKIAMAGLDGSFTIRQCPMAPFIKPNGYLPYRNAILCLLAGQLDDEIVVSQIAEWAPDKNLRFGRRLTKLMRQAGKGSTQGMNAKPRISAPFHGFTKLDLLEEYRAKFGRSETVWLLRHTWSCYSGGDLHCGACSGCRQRYTAEVASGLRITSYARTPSLDLSNDHWVDALRWMRDNRGVGGLLKRAAEAHMARYNGGLRE